jgi:hypothetical protein
MIRLYDACDEQRLALLIAEEDGFGFGEYGEELVRHEASAFYFVAPGNAGCAGYGVGRYFIIGTQDRGAEHYGCDKGLGCGAPVHRQAYGDVPLYIDSIMPGSGYGDDHAECAEVLE